MRAIIANPIPCQPFFFFPFPTTPCRAPSAASLQLLPNMEYVPTLSDHDYARMAAETTQEHFDVTVFHAFSSPIIPELRAPTKADCPLCASPQCAVPKLTAPMSAVAGAADARPVVDAERAPHATVQLADPSMPAAAGIGARVPLAAHHCGSLAHMSRAQVQEVLVKCFDCLQRAAAECGGGACWPQMRIMHEAAEVPVQHAAVDVQLHIEASAELVQAIEANAAHYLATGQPKLEALCAMPECCVFRNEGWAGFAAVCPPSDSAEILLVPNQRQPCVLDAMGEPLMVRLRDALHHATQVLLLTLGDAPYELLLLSLPAASCLDADVDGPWVQGEGLGVRCAPCLDRHCTQPPRKGSRGTCGYAPSWPAPPCASCPRFRAWPPCARPPPARARMLARQRRSRRATSASPLTGWRPSGVARVGRWTQACWCTFSAWPWTWWADRRSVWRCKGSSRGTRCRCAVPQRQQQSRLVLTAGGLPLQLGGHVGTVWFLPRGAVLKCTMAAEAQAYHALAAQPALHGIAPRCAADPRPGEPAGSA